MSRYVLLNDYFVFLVVSAPASPANRPVMATMAALAGMSTAAIATGPRTGSNHQQQHQRGNRNALHSRENVPLRPVVRNSVSWDDVKPSSARLKQQNQYPPLVNETWWLGRSQFIPASHLYCKCFLLFRGRKGGQRGSVGFFSGFSRSFLGKVIDINRSHRRIRSERD